MTTPLRYGWKKTILISFITGTFMLGLTDFFHTATGVQRYLFRSEVLMITGFNWPIYLPFQMGMIAVSIVLIWTFAFNRFIHPAISLREEDDTQPFGNWLPAHCVLMVLAGFLLGFVTLGYDDHISLYLVIYFASLVLLAWRFSRYYLLAFLLIGAAGPLFEWFLLSPAIGYYDFVQKDLFGRVPAWQLFVYGWGGVLVHWVTAGVRKYS